MAIFLDKCQLFKTVKVHSVLFSPAWLLRHLYAQLWISYLPNKPVSCILEDRCASQWILNVVRRIYGTQITLRSWTNMHAAAAAAAAAAAGQDRYSSPESFSVIISSDFASLSVFSGSPAWDSKFLKVKSVIYSPTTGTWCAAFLED